MSTVTEIDWPTRAMQQFLFDLGLYDGPVTGEKNEATKEALEKWRTQTMEEETRDQDALQLLEDFIALLGRAKALNLIKEGVDLSELQVAFGQVLNVDDPERVFNVIIERLCQEEKDKGGPESEGDVTPAEVVPQGFQVPTIIPPAPGRRTR